MDVLIVTLAVQVGTMLSDYFWYLFLVVMTYLLMYISQPRLIYIDPRLYYLPLWWHRMVVRFHTQSFGIITYNSMLHLSSLDVGLW